MPVIERIIIAVVCLIIGVIIGFLYRKNVAEKEIGSAEQEATRIINDAIKSGETKKREAVLEAKDEIHKSRTEADREIKERRNEVQKLDIYKRIAAIENEEEKEDMVEELTDRFGDIPRKVEKLLEAASLKAMAHNVYVTSVEQKGETYYFTMYEKAKIHPGKIPSLINEFRGDLTLKTDGESPCFIYEKKIRIANLFAPDFLYAK